MREKRNGNFGGKEDFLESSDGFSAILVSAALKAFKGGSRLGLKFVSIDKPVNSYILGTLQTYIHSWVYVDTGFCFTRVSTLRVYTEMVVRSRSGAKFSSPNDTHGATSAARDSTVRFAYLSLPFPSLPYAYTLCTVHLQEV